MGFRRIARPGTADSQSVIANATRSLLEAQNFPGQVRGSEAVSVNFSKVVESPTQRLLDTNVVASLVPGRTALNAQVTVRQVEGLQKPALSASESENLEARIRADIPTADLIDSGGFKTGSKMLIKIVASANSTIIPDKSAPNLTFNNFSMQGIAETDGERYQIHETFGEEVVYMFGRRPRVWTMQGVVLNGKRAPDQGEGPETAAETAAREAKDMDFANTLLLNWEKYYRGTKAVEARARAYISYEDSVIEATLVELTVVRNSQIPSAANATITFIVHERAFIGKQFSNGVDAQQLAQLAATVNANGDLVDIVPASDIIPARPTLDEIVRRENAAAAKLQRARNAERVSKDGITAMRQRLAELEKSLALIDAVLDATPDEAEENARRERQIRSDIQALEAQLKLEGQEVELSELAREGAQAQADALAATRQAHYAGQAL